MPDESLAWSLEAQRKDCVVHCSEAPGTKTGKNYWRARHSEAVKVDLESC